MPFSHCHRLPKNIRVLRSTRTLLQVLNLWASVEGSETIELLETSGSWAAQLGLNCDKLPMCC